MNHTGFALHLAQEQTIIVHLQDVENNGFKREAFLKGNH